MMKTAKVLCFVSVLALPTLAFGLTGNVGVQLAGGGSTINMAAPGALGSTLVVTTVATDTDLNGLQYYLQAWLDNGNGVLDAGDTSASSLFKYNSTLTTTKAAPYGSTTTVAIRYEDHGAFYSPYDPELFAPGDVASKPAIGDTLDIATFWSIFRSGSGDLLDQGYVNGTNALDPGWTTPLVMQHDISSVGELQGGKYFLSTGDNSGGFLLCPPGAGCTTATRGGYITLTVLPEPMSALLLLGALPFVARRRR